MEYELWDIRFCMNFDFDFDVFFLWLRCEWANTEQTTK